MALIIEAPNEVYSLENSNNIKLFLAGGITGCSNWQKYVIDELSDISDLTIYNPRRKNFPINDFKATEQQITWEFEHLRDSNLIFFWFARGSLNPIVLYELGMWANSTETPVIIGIDPEYERKQDVIIQTKLARPNLLIFDSIQDMITEVHNIFSEIPNEED